MTDRKPVTLADLKASTFSMQMHARMGKGGFLRAVVGVEFSRVSISTSRASARDPVIRTLFVDDVECATLDQVLERLNAPAPEAS